MRSLPLSAAIAPIALALLAPYTVAQQTQSLNGEARALLVAAQPDDDPSAENLERALDSIRIENLRADITFIASDALAGRDSPSPGLTIAARYIRARLMRLGWTPGASDGYLYDYSLKQYTLNESATFASYEVDGETRRLELGSGYYISPQARGNRDLSGSVVFAGGFKEEQVENISLQGKWAMLSPGTRLSRKSRGRAQDSGVLGFLVLPDPDAERTVAETHGRWMDNIKRPSSRPPNSRGVPTIYLSEEVAEDIVSRAAIEEPVLGQALEFTFRESYGVNEDEGIHLENVCGLWPGSDPLLQSEVIIVSAHYDHKGSRENGDIYNGADDNGSGTTGLMAIAEALKAYGPMRRTIMLMWVSAEEKGLLGSAAWTKDPWLPEGMRPLCNINIDMIGRNAPDELGITPTKARPEYNRLTQVAENNRALEGFKELNSADAYWSRSDHANFSRNLGIPVAFLFSDVHEDYHKPTDTVDKIDLDKMRRVTRLVVRMLHDLQADDLDL